MAQEDRSAYLGVRRRIVVGHTSPRVALTVFCPRQLESTHVDVCRSCSRAVVIDEVAVTCAADPRRAEVLVGAAMGHESITFEGNLTVARAACQIGATALAAVVVDPDQGVRGLVHREDLATADRGAGVDEIARRVNPVFEASPVMGAVRRMARERARALPVVNTSRFVVGVVTDIDVLHWAAKSRSLT